MAFSVSIPTKIQSILRALLYILTKGHEAGLFDENGQPVTHLKK